MDFVQLSKTILFQGTSPDETEAMLKCLSARKKKYQKSETVYYAGDTVTDMGIVLSGSVLIENDDIWETAAFWIKSDRDRYLRKRTPVCRGRRCLLRWWLQRPQRSCF